MFQLRVLVSILMTQHFFFICGGNLVVASTCISLVQAGQIGTVTLLVSRGLTRLSLSSSVREILMPRSSSSSSGMLIASSSSTGGRFCGGGLVAGSYAGLFIKASRHLLAGAK